MAEVRIQEDAQYELVHKTGTLVLDYEMEGAHLDKELRQATEDFIRVMELRGLTLYQPPGGRLKLPDGTLMSNPMWIEAPDGEAAQFYAIDWEGKRPPPKKNTAGGLVDLPHDREMNLEDTQGEVEYRIIGLFWTQAKSIELITNKRERLEAERLAKQPTTFGPGGVSTPKELPIQYREGAL